MAVRRVKSLIVCDTESERLLIWGNGQEILCLDTEKKYTIIDGAFVEDGGGGSGSGLSQYQVRRIIRR